MINLTFDFGGTRIKIGLLQQGKILAQKIIDNHSQMDDLSHCISAAHTLCAEQKLPIDHIAAVGVSLPGIVDIRNNTMLSVNEKYQYSIGFDYAAWSAQHFPNRPFIIDNDARLALLGEVGYGAAQGYQDVVLMILGTGVGSAAMIEGNMLRGKHYQAGILGGHFSVNYKGSSCNCGGTGCVEACASTWAMPKITKNTEGFESSILAQQDLIDCKAITDAARQKDRFAEKMLDHFCRVWGAALVNLVHAYDPEAIVMSGGLMHSHDLILPRLQQYVRHKAWTPWGTPTFLIAEDFDTSVIKGLDYALQQQKLKDNI